MAFKIPLRFWIAVMLFMTAFTNYMLRANMSMSLVAMKVPREKRTPPCATEKKNATNKTEDYGPRYKWKEDEDKNIIAAYFWGYTTTCLPAGTLAELVGPVYVISISSLISAIITIIIPFTTADNPLGIILCRYFVGFCGGLAYPAINVLIARWAPPSEKGKFTSTLLGNTLGIVVSWPIIGVIISQGKSWPWSFYSLGIFMIIYSVLFFIVVSDTPRKHYWISQEEQKFILESQEGKVSAKKAFPPYLKILTSIRFWALVAAQFSNLYGLNLVVTYAPKFLSETLGFDVKKSAIIAASPYLARLITSQLFGIVGDYIVNKGIMRKTFSRKFFIIFSHFLPALCLLLILAAKCNHVPVVALLIMSQGFNGAVIVGHLINPQDLAPNFAGTLYAIMNFLGTTSGFIAPEVTKAFNRFYKSELPASQWIFTIGAIIFSAGGIVFIILGTSDLQPWNEIKEKEPDAAAGPAPQ